MSHTVTIYYDERTSFTLDAMDWAIGVPEGWLQLVLVDDRVHFIRLDQIKGIIVPRLTPPDESL